jgi:hypothetical protein
MTKFLLSIVIIGSAFFGFGQINPQIKDYYPFESKPIYLNKSTVIRNKIKDVKVKEYSFDSSNIQTSPEYAYANFIFNYKGELVKTIDEYYITKYYYNLNSDLIKVEKYDTYDEQLIDIKSYTYKYNNEGQIIESERKLPNAHYFQKNIYDKKGNKVKSEFSILIQGNLNAEHSVINYKYNSLNQLIYSKSTNDSTLYAYDINKNLIEKRTYSDNSETSTNSYRYDNE